MPHGMHEVGIEQARRAWHGQNEAVGLNNLMVDTMHVVAVAGIGGQVLERVVVVDKGHSIALEAVIPNETVVLERTETVSRLVTKRLPDLLLQGEVKGRALETTLIIHALNPGGDVTGCTPELTHRERGPHLGIVVSEMFRLKAARIVIAEALIAQLILEIAQVGDYLLLRDGIVMVDVTRPGALTSVTTAVGVTATHAALIVPTKVSTLSVLVPVPLDGIGLTRLGSDNIHLINKVGGKLLAAPCAQAALVIGDHILHGSGSSLLVGTDEVDKFSLGAKVALG